MGDRRAFLSDSFFGAVSTWTLTISLSATRISSRVGRWFLSMIQAWNQGEPLSGQLIAIELPCLSTTRDGCVPDLVTTVTLSLIAIYASSHALIGCRADWGMK